MLSVNDRFTLIAVCHSRSKSFCPEYHNIRELKQIKWSAEKTILTMRVRSVSYIPPTNSCHDKRTSLKSSKPQPQIDS